MTKEQLQKDHPEVYASIFETGVTAEKARVEGILVFLDADPKACKAAIEAGVPLSDKAKNELLLAQYKKDQVAITAAAAPGANATSTKQPEDVEQTAKQKEVSDFEIAARKKLGLKIA